MNKIILRFSIRSKTFQLKSEDMIQYHYSNVNPTDLWSVLNHLPTADEIVNSVGDGQSQNYQNVNIVPGQLRHRKT